MTPQPQTGLASRETFRDRRRSARIATNDPAVLHLLNPASPERYDVRVLDVSKGGCKLLTSKYFQKGTLVQVRWRESVASGEVRYCVPAKDGFYVGVQVTDMFALPSPRL